jgi:hypothetical protein
MKMRRMRLEGIGNEMGIKKQKIKIKIKTYEKIKIMNKKL